MVQVRFRISKNVGAICLLLLLFAYAQEGHSEEFDVIFLGGQSNMEGFGSVKDLPDHQRQIDGAFIFHVPAALDQKPIVSDGHWLPLRAGHGTGFAMRGQEAIYSDRFGVELSLAQEILKHRTGRKLALIKYARNGSSIHQAAAENWGCWEPDFLAADGEHRSVNQYDHFLATIRLATSDTDIDDDSVPDTLHPIGIIWMQGESDARFTPEIAKEYEANLKRLTDLMRAALRVDDLPVVIGQISDSGKHESGKVWTHGEIVREAQAAFVQKDPAAKLITTTDSYQYSDPWHYDSAGYLDLGRQFANALRELSR